MILLLLGGYFISNNAHREDTYHTVTNQLEELKLGLVKRNDMIAHMTNDIYFDSQFFTKVSSFQMPGQIDFIFQELQSLFKTDRLHRQLTQESRKIDMQQKNLVMSLRSIRRSVADKFHLVEVLRVKTQTSVWMFEMSPHAHEKTYDIYLPLKEKIMDGYDLEKVEMFEDELKSYKNFIHQTNLGFFHAIYALMLVIWMWGVASLLVDWQRSRHHFI